MKNIVFIASLCLLIGCDPPKDQESGCSGETGAALFEEHCAACHGEAGEGIDSLGDITEEVATLGATALMDQILEGGNGMQPIALCETDAEILVEWIQKEGL
jgi:cytochrome c